MNVNEFLPCKNIQINSDDNFLEKLFLFFSPRVEHNYPLIFGRIISR